VSETPEKQHFVNYTPRHLSVFRQGYSVFVRVMKLALPLVALTIVAVLVIRMTMRNPSTQNLAAHPQGAAAQKTTPGQIELVGPKYQGVDNQNRPYTVTADKATRDLNAPDNVQFTNPEADITLSNKTWLAAKAKTGIFNHAADTLVLTDEVSIYHDSGYELHAQDMHIDLKNKTASTALPVQGQGPIGTIEGKNMVVQDQGNLIVFGGPATLVLFRLAGGKGHG
jgi:lipopolysaccharide export system protein LptC